MNVTQIRYWCDRITRRRFLVIVPSTVFFFTLSLFVGSDHVKPLFDHGINYNNSDGVVNLGPQPKLCGALKSASGFLLISGLIQDLPESRSFGFLQTSDAEDGLFFDFDQIPRVGLPLDDGTVSYTVIDTSLKSYPVRDAMKFAILLSADGTLSYFEDRDLVRVSLNNPIPKCENVRFGIGNESAAYSGRIAVSVSSGLDINSANKLLEQYRSQFTSTTIRLYQWSKNAFIFSLIILTLGNPFKKRDPLKPTTESVSN